MGRMERHLDLDAIARVKAGIKFKPEPVKRRKRSRPSFTYRGNWRNICRERGRHA